MKNKEVNIPISIERFQELVAIEARIKALVDRIIHEKYVSEEEALCAIGTKEAMQELGRREKKKEGREAQEEIL